jgi:hypothetical protein
MSGAGLKAVNEEHALFSFEPRAQKRRGDSRKLENNGPKSLVSSASDRFPTDGKRRKNLEKVACRKRQLASA